LGLLLELVPRGTDVGVLALKRSVSRSRERGETIDLKLLAAPPDMSALYTEAFLPK